MTTKITSNNIESASLALLGGPKITAIAVTTSSYTVLDDTAVDVAGGYIKLTGTGFESSCQVVVNNIAATTVTFISSTEVRAQLPATTAGTYIVYLINPTGGVAIRVNGVTFSAVPAWSTASTLPDGASGTAVSIQLGATSNSSITYALAAGSTLPTGLSLSTGGLLSGTVTVSNPTTYNFTLVATDAELQDTSRAFSINITVGEAYFVYNSLLLSANGTNLAQNNTFLDSSASNFTVTRNGNPTQGSFSPYGNNWSNYFNGSGDKLSAGTNAAFALGSGDFTVESWFYLNNTATAMCMFENRPSNTATGINMFVNYSAAGQVQYRDSTGAPISSSITVSAGTWNHYALVRNGSTITLWINGQSAGTVTKTTTFTDTTCVLAQDQGGGFNFGGYLSNFRIVKGTAVYTSAFTPSTTPLTAIANTSLLTCQKNRFVDTSSNAFAITFAGAPTVQRFTPFSPGGAYSTTTIGGSGYFDGTGDYLDVTGANCLLTGDFTVEAWVYPTSWGAYQRVISGGTGSFYWSLGFSNTSGWGGALKINWYDGTDYYSSAQATAPLYTWYHLAVVRTGSTLYYYINGVQNGTSAYSTTPGNATGGITIGRRQVAGEPWFGYISDARVVIGTNMYGTGATATIPTAPLTAPANTKVLFSGTNAGIVDGAMQNVVETIGSAKISTAQSKFGGSSILFNGSTDCCFLPNTQAFLLNGGDFTVELWAYIGDTTARKYVLGPGTDTASHYKGLGIEIWSQQLCVWASSNGTGWNMIECDTAANRGATLLAANTWYHIAVTRSGNTIRSFVNGVVEKTYTVSGAIFSDATIPYNIGRVAYLGGGFYYNGYMDDFRVTKGYARYTANFTPPASALLAQ